MKIVILAGGVSKRMWPIQQDKLLLDFLGKSLFHHVLKPIIKTKLFDQYIIVANPNNQEKLQKISQDLGIKVEIVLQKQAEGMADALLSAADLISGEILIVNGDDLLESSLFEQISDLSKQVAVDIILSGQTMKQYFPGGYLKLKDDKVLGVIEKPGAGNEPSNIMKIVADYFRSGEKLVGYLKKCQSDKDDVYEVALDRMMQDGLNIQLNRYDGRWVTVKYPWHVLSVMEILFADIEQRIDPLISIAKTAIIEGNVVIEAGVKIFEGAVVKGPAYIGKNCIIGSNSLVREAILGEGCVVGFNTEIARSYVGTNSWFHTNYIGDSVIEGDFGMGSGAVLANLRLDGQTIKATKAKIDTNMEKLGLISGKGVRVGVNASTMPGVMVGSNSLIGPGVVLNHDVEENSQIVLRQEYQVTQKSKNITSYDQFRNKI